MLGPAKHTVTTVHHRTTEQCCNAQRAALQAGDLPQCHVRHVLLAGPRRQAPCTTTPLHAVYVCNSHLHAMAACSWVSRVQRMSALSQAKAQMPLATPVTPRMWQLCYALLGTFTQSLSNVANHARKDTTAQAVLSNNARSAILTTPHPQQVHHLLTSAPGVPLGMEAGLTALVVCAAHASKAASQVRTSER
jgi:hypothetical protein